jgi:hypothetical protein
MTATGDLDRVINAVDTTIETLRYDDLEPAELSAIVGALRELFWHTTTLTTVLAGVYDHQHGLEHDHDPASAVAAVGVGLCTAAKHLARLDRTLADVHNTAAHLHRR